MKHDATTTTVNYFGTPVTVTVPAYTVRVTDGTVVINFGDRDLHIGTVGRNPGGVWGSSNNRGRVVTRMAATRNEAMAPLVRQAVERRASSLAAAAVDAAR